MNTFCPHRQGRSKRDLGQGMKPFGVNEIQACPFKGPDKETEQFQMTEVSGALGL